MLTVKQIHVRVVIGLLAAIMTVAAILALAEKAQERVDEATQEMHAPHR